MEIIFGLFSLIVLAALGVGSVMVLLFFARKNGVYKLATNRS